MLEEVLSTNLEIGMYVHKLDRPWTETPFIFQGFNIKTPEDIKTLQKYCFLVYINTTKDSRVSEKNLTHQAISSKKNRVLPKKNKNYKIRSRFEKELKYAKFTYRNLAYNFSLAYKQMRSNKKLKIRVLKKAVKSVVGSVLRNPDAFLLISKLKLADFYYFNHSLNCSILSASFGRYLGLKTKEIINLGLGALLCDIGITKLPKEILENKDQLNGDQFELYKSHVNHSLNILRKTRGINRETLTIVQFHHEQYNGQGFPNRIVGSRIPILAQIVPIVDCYQSLISPRNCKDAITTMDAISEMNQYKNRRFQSELVDSFVHSVGIYSTGSIVELSTGEIGIVISQHSIKKLKPKVMLVLDKSKQKISNCPIINLDIADLGRNNHHRNIVKTHLANEFNIDIAKYVHV